MSVLAPAVDPGQYERNMDAARTRLAALERRHDEGEHHFAFTGRTFIGDDGPKAVYRCAFCLAQKTEAFRPFDHGEELPDAA